MATNSRTLLPTSGLRPYAIVSVSFLYEISIKLIQNKLKQDMGLLNGILGNASAVALDDLQQEYQPILIEGEYLEMAFKVIRDMFVFTNKRLILVDKQGLTGKKVEYLSIPYGSITRFSKESAGMMDLDAELRIWIRGQAEPIKKEFRKGDDVNAIYLLLSQHTLK